MFLQRVMQDMRGRVRPANPLATLGIDHCLDGITLTNDPFGELSEMDDQLPVFLGVGHLELEILADQFAGVADLTATFAVEGGLIEHDSHGFCGSGRRVDRRGDLQGTRRPRFPSRLRRLQWFHNPRKGVLWRACLSESSGPLAPMTVCCTLPEASPWSSIAWA